MTNQKTLQSIIDSYYERGLRGDELREALNKDLEYQHILSERKAKISKQFSILDEDLEKYVLSVDEDWEILSKIYELESKNLSAQDRELIKFIRSQLEHDWRKPLMEKLNNLLDHYR